MKIEKLTSHFWEDTLKKHQRKREVLKNFNYNFVIKHQNLEIHTRLNRSLRPQRISSLININPEAIRYAPKNYSSQYYIEKISKSESIEIKFAEEGEKYLTKLKSDKTDIYRKSDIILLELLLNSLSHDLKKKERKNNSSN
ncbi:MAG TPA: hypothetical protein ENH91_01225 [Leeuwenhoekiella sp.]|nr:hypothetical protein [Leeuwenhoekiella sp.]